MVGWRRIDARKTFCLRDTSSLRGEKKVRGGAERRRKSQGLPASANIEMRSIIRLEIEIKDNKSLSVGIDMFPILIEIIAQLINSLTNHELSNMHTILRFDY